MLLAGAYFYAAFTLSEVTKDLLPSEEHQLAIHRLPLSDRQPSSFINQVFKDNILLCLTYLKGVIKQGDRIDWSQIEQPGHYEFTLNPGQVFAFHDQVLPGYQNKVSKTTNSHFGADQGFKNDGYLTGDGVCHLASLFSWTAKDANLAVEVPTAHDFAPVPDVPKEDGVSIYDQPNLAEESSKQNLYITNSYPKPVKFIIDYDQNQVSLAINEL